MDRLLLACFGAALTLGVVSPSAGSLPSFAGPITFRTDREPEGIAIGDLNRDGKPEVATANYADDTASVFWNYRVGSRIEGLDNRYETGIGPGSVAIADLNGDNFADIATANAKVDTVSVLLNTGDDEDETKAFARHRDYRTGRTPSFIAIGDLDNDGKRDLVTANVESNTVSVLAGNGNGSFKPRVDLAVGPEPWQVAIGDLNRDGSLDLVTANGRLPGTASVLLNKGGGTFARRDYTDLESSSVAIGDLNGDRKPDLVMGDSDGALIVLLNNGDGTFRTLEGAYNTLGEVLSLVIRDMNGDGKADVVTGNYRFFFSVHLGRGDGTFVGGRDYTIGSEPSSVAVGDLNGDGKPDVAVADAQRNVASLLANSIGRCGVPNVRGSTLPNAKRAIANAHCRLGTVRRVYDPYVKAGRVFTQTPNFGAVLARGSKVNLVLSRGRKP